MREIESILYKLYHHRMMERNPDISHAGHVQKLIRRRSTNPTANTRWFHCVEKVVGCYDGESGFAIQKNDDGKTITRFFVLPNQNTFLEIINGGYGGDVDIVGLTKDVRFQKVQESSERYKNTSFEIEDLLDHRDIVAQMMTQLLLQYIKNPFIEVRNNNTSQKQGPKDGPTSVDIVDSYPTFVDLLESCVAEDLYSKTFSIYDTNGKLLFGKPWMCGSTYQN